MTRPIEQLPIELPKDYDPGPEFFYENIIKPLIPDMIKLMDHGIKIDKNKVAALEKTIEVVQKTVKNRLENSLWVEKLEDALTPMSQKKHAEKALQKLRKPEYYMRDYKPTDIVQRSSIVNNFLEERGLSHYYRSKWTIKNLKDLLKATGLPFIQSLINKEVKFDNPIVTRGLLKLAEHKAELWNRVAYEKAKMTVDRVVFNPNSHKHLSTLFGLMGVETGEKSKKTGKDSYGREQLEDCLKAVNNLLDD